jgi:toxin ParE1/3/4
VSRRLRLVVTEAADSDIVEAAGYLAEAAGTDVALRFYLRVDGAFLMLSSNPSIGHPRSFRRADLAAMRSWRVPGFDNWLIFYRATSRKLEIVRVVHGARDLDRLFGDDDA